MIANTNKETVVDGDFFFGELVKEISFGTWEIVEKKESEDTIFLVSKELPREIVLYRGCIVLFVSNWPVYSTVVSKSEYGNSQFCQTLDKVTKFSNEEKVIDLMNYLISYYRLDKKTIESL